MNKLILLLLTMCVFLFSSFSHAKPAGEALDQIVAIVNDDVITRSELMQNMSVATMQMKEAGMPIPSSSALKKQVLDDLINKKLLLQASKQAGISVSDKDVMQAVQNIAKQNKLTVAELYAQLAKTGMSASMYKEEIHDQLTMQKLNQEQIINRITITPEEVKQFSRNNKTKSFEEREYQIEDVLIPLSDKPSKSEVVAANEKANVMIAGMREGKAAEKNLEWRKLSDIPSAYVSSLAKTNTRDVIGPIQTGNGLHILRVVNVRVINSAPPEQENTANELMKQKFNEALKNLIIKLRGEAYIVIN